MEIFNTFVLSKLFKTKKKTMKKLIKLSVLLLLIFQSTKLKAVEKGDFNIYLTTNLGHHSSIPNSGV